MTDKALEAAPTGTKFKEPCGGCGQEYASQRCLGCLHETDAWNRRAPLEALPGEAEVERSGHADDILAESAKFQCHECLAEEREFSCHDLDDVVIVDGKVVCKECAAEFYPKARVKKAPDIGKKLRRQRMFAHHQQARAEKAERERDEAQGRAAAWAKEEGQRQAELGTAISRAESAEARVKELEEVVRGLLGIVDDSAGVSGYHLSGDVAEWDEFAEVDAARTVLTGGSNG